MEVSALGLGCMGMSFGYGPAADKQEMMSLIRTAVECGITFFTALQSEYSLWWRKPEAEVPTREELGIGFVPFSPLGKGFLTRKINEDTTFDRSDFRNIAPRFTPDARKANQALVDLLRSIGYFVRS